MFSCGSSWIVCQGERRNCTLKSLPKLRHLSYHSSTASHLVLFSQAIPAVAPGWGGVVAPGFVECLWLKHLLRRQRPVCVQVSWSWGQQGVTCHILRRWCMAGKVIRWGVSWSRLATVRPRGSSQGWRVVASWRSITVSQWHLLKERGPELHGVYSLTF